MAIDTFFTSEPATAQTVVGEFLRRDPIRHNVLLTLLAARVASSTPIRFWWATVDGIVGGALFQSPDDFPVISSVLDPQVIQPLAEEVAAAVGKPINELEGTVDSASRLAGTFATVTKRPARPVEGQRIYEIRDLRHPAQPAPGAARLATRGDRDVIAQWLAGFAQDTGTGRSTETDLAAAAELYVDTGRLHLWEDDVPRASTYEQAPAAGVVRVGFVYTPPADRGRGYASALVAHVSRAVLAAGRRCILYTQLANPTSNGIYHALGDQPVAEVVRYRLD